MGTLPPVFVEFIGSVGGFKAATKEVQGELKKVEKSGGGNFTKLGVIGKAALAGIGGATIAAAGAAIKMAGDFQQQMTRVATGAGELQSNLKADAQGILQMAGEVGQSTKDLTAGLYMVNSAGYHGADGLKVLKAAAEGAKVGNAELPTVADAVTTALNAYHMSADQAAQATNALIAAEGQGKTNMEDLAGSLATVLPVASTAKVGLNEVLAALSTMTSEGTPAADAATYLKQTIAQLENPSGKAAQEMQSLGLSSVKVAQSLGSRGLAATLTMLTDAIKAKMGPAGTVLVEHLQKAAKSSTDFQKVLAGLPPAQQTYVGALADMVGGTKSMQAALELTGDNMTTFKNNITAINQHVKAGGNEIEGWKEVQKNFNQQLAEAKGKMEALGISIGQKLMPVASKMLGWVMDSASWLGKHKTVLIAVASVLGGALTVGLMVATVAAWNFAAALLANPLTWIILGIGALIFIIVELAMHWKTVWKAIKNVAGDVWHFLVKVWDSIAKDTAKFWHNDIVKPIKEAWDKAGKWIDDAVDWFKKLPGRIGHALAELPGELFRAWTHGMERMLYAIGFGIGWAIKQWLAMPGRIWRIITELWSTATTLVSRGFDAVIDFFVKLPGRAKTEVTKLWTEASTDFSNGVDVIVGWVEKLPGRVEHWFAETYRKATNWASKAVTDVTKFFEQLPDKAWHAFQNMSISIWNAVKDAGSWLVNTGHDIIMGLIHGIENAVGDAVHAVGRAMGDILKGAKDALGIASPSKVFRDEVGQWIPHGIAEGVSRHAGVAMDAVTSLTGRLGGVPALAMAGVGGPSGGAGVNVAGSGMLEATIEIDGTAFVRAIVPYVQRTNGRNSSNFFGQGGR